MSNLESVVTREKLLAWILCQRFQTTSWVYSQFAPVTNSPHLNMGRVGIECYQPNFWRLYQGLNWISSNWPMQKFL